MIDKIEEAGSDKTTFFELLGGEAGGIEIGRAHV